VNGELGAGVNGKLGWRIRSCCSVGKVWSEGTGTSLVYGAGQEGWTCFGWGTENALFTRRNHGIRIAYKRISKANSKKLI